MGSASPEALSWASWGLPGRMCWLSYGLANALLVDGQVWGSIDVGQGVGFWVPGMGPFTKPKAVRSPFDFPQDERTA